MPADTPATDPAVHAYALATLRAEGVPGTTEDLLELLQQVAAPEVEEPEPSAE